MEPFNFEDINSYIVRFGTRFLDFLPNIISAVLLLFVGLWLIKMIKKIIIRIFNSRDVEETLKQFLLGIIGWTLKILLFITVISQLGVQTSSFVAMIAAAGLAIGLALQGSLANFAGGVLIMLFKPFKVDDFIEAQGQSGTIKEVAIFYTKMVTINNQLVILPNGKLSNETIINYTSEGKRRDVLTFGISYNSDIKKAKEVLISLMKEQEHILKDPEPLIFVAELNESSVDLSARFWALNENFWDCHFYTIEEAKTRLEAAGINIPFPQRDLHLYNVEKTQPKKE
ncbi:MAG: mechanosensitive ion channel protein [Flavobacteriaceae bacterium CG_4_8_14_3_um_filter_34_10]|nr:mechanosensitive ion channel [Flavobacteriia bacterium]OIP49764.1 MAG: mechanosensitive ion channel protein [Flavobacteriaceae bacterium CG2_30_34_30]PIQ19211.1 MAG: mechanosensitive ion channel protein [Flavobacteriaceae bacterium CG18_big_fil_WC_8_21_14_2_50_34_36]PIV48554.1 MAG: mechanosensitive ion channel protein [Flavobacteriaceae bacterium CG02_land_8_20_14_3_00_34_13]PIX10028.1 MAG: mechanosensitive ion channel protein [Flavobacteriaceae bacterium CG_4_8_14_3_um_filter_34_10]PIZ0766